MAIKHPVISHLLLAAPDDTNLQSHCLHASIAFVLLLLPDVGGPSTLPVHWRLLGCSTLHSMEMPTVTRNNKIVVQSKPLVSGTCDGATLPQDPIVV